ncbi:MAG: hypothetical protein JNJ78_11015 [Anaerolineae bacterium]|nr:hypothetical protein [Anaerolineae bacterium]
MIDPNVVYLVLVLGLWLTVTAAYIPGTGILEGAALAGLIGGVAVLANMPTNWAGAILLIIGVLVFLLIPFLGSRLGRIAEAGLILQVIGAGTLFHGIQVSWLLIAVTVLLSILYHRLVLRPVLERALAQNAVRDDNGQLIGAMGRVSKASERVGTQHIGTVNVDGEPWTAISNYPLRIGEEVVVLERNGLQLMVEGIKHKQTLRENMEES